MINTTPFTVTSLWTFANYANWNTFSFFGLSVKPCTGLENSNIESGCDTYWSESSSSGTSVQHRNLLRIALSQAENKLASYLNYWPGPKYIEEETHYLSGWNRLITTDYRKVVQTGTRVRERLFDNNDVTMTRDFRSHYYDSVSVSDTIRYTFGDGVTSLGIPKNCQILAFPEGFDTVGRGSGPLDSQKEINEAYMLRPITVIEQTDTSLIIDVPLQVAVKPQLYFTFPDVVGNTRALSACDPDNFVEDLVIYAEYWDRPDGYVRIDNRQCTTCNDSTCDACQLEQIPICLTPVSSDRGKFRVTPVRNTADEGETPCWVVDTLDSCCRARYGARLGSYYCNAYGEKPLEVCINYVSSCANCFRPECTTYDACPELIEALVKMTIANMAILCRCDCLTSQSEELRANWAISSKAGSFSQFNPELMYSLGTKVGDVEAWISVQHLPGAKRSGMTVGMV